jgi:hypothetical protein
MIDLCAQDLSDTIFKTYDMPFDMRKSILNNCDQDDNCDEVTKSTNSPSSPVNSEDKFDKLLRDLDFIDQPLAPKRLRAKKSDKCLKLLTISNQTSESNENSCSTNETDEEKRRRKNKDQVKILQNEYLKNPAWDRAYMKELAKKTGLKPSQVYKWNWDQKKKEIEDQKLKRLFYPNEIFQVVDNTTGKNITKPVFQKFTIARSMVQCQ